MFDNTTYKYILSLTLFNPPATSITNKINLNENNTMLNRNEKELFLLCK